MKTYQGILRQLTEPERFDFWTNDGEHLEDIRFKGSVPLESHIEIVLDGNFIVDWTRLSSASTEYDRPPVVWDRSQTRKHLAMFLVRPDALQDGDQKRIEDEARRLQHFTRAFSRGAWDVEVRGYAVVGPTPTSVTNINSSWFRGWLAENDPDFAHTYIGVRGGFSVSFCGNAFLGGNVFFTSANCPWRTSMHEWLHCFGGDHNGWGDPGSRIAEYADIVPGMLGNNPMRDRVLATQQHFFGLVNPDYIHVIERRRVERHFIVDWDTQDPGVKPGEHKIVYVDQKANHNEHYCVSYAKGRVWVHRYDPMHFGRHDIGYRKTWGLARLAPGAKHRSTIEVDFKQPVNGAAEVVIRYDADDSTNPGFSPAPNFVIEGQVPITDKHAGLWDNPEWSHQGLMIYRVRDDLAGTWYTWDTNEFPIWFQLQGPIVDGVADVELYRPDASRNLHRDGTALLYFSGPDHGWFKYDSQTMGRGAIPLTRTATLDGPLTGFYELAGQTHEGITVIDALTDKGERIIFGVHFGYRPRPTYSLNPGIIWRPFDGASPGGLSVYEMMNGYPSIAFDTDAEVVGTAAMTETELTYLGKTYELNKLA